MIVIPVVSGGNDSLDYATRKHNPPPDELAVGGSGSAADC
jgi:hypothetical protein